jgi:hypothetical protein
MRKMLTAFAVFLLFLLGGQLLSPGPVFAATPRLVYHHCEEIISDGLSDYEGVHCANLWMEGTNKAWGENEILCQDFKGNLKECQGIVETPGICKVGSACTYGGQGICGEKWDHSACGLRRVKNVSPTITGCVTVRARTIDTLILLPDGYDAGGIGRSTETATAQTC